MVLLTLYAFIAIAVSFVCSLLEAVILSVTHAYIEVSKNKGRRSGFLLNDLKVQIDRPLAAILTLNTIAHTLGAAGVGAQVSEIYGSSFVAVASGILTFAVLILSEIIPKTLGASYWKALAPVSAYAIHFLIFATYPFVILSREIRGLLSPKNNNLITREEMIETAHLGAKGGSIRHKESQIIRNLLMLDNIKVTDIMTPRSVIVTMDWNKTVGEVMDEDQQNRFSRIPLYSSDLDHIEGLLHRYRLMEAASQDLDSLQLKKLMTPIHSVPESISVAAALDQFIKRKEHLFLVVDDYGSTEGIVTLEDAIETLLGVEIVDEFDSVEDMREYALEQWRTRKQKLRPEKI